MIDILMNFRTTYVKEGEVLITSPWKIAVHYLKTYFVVDFVAAIPWDLLASFNSGTEEVSALHMKLSFLGPLESFKTSSKGSFLGSSPEMFLNPQPRDLVQARCVSHSAALPPLLSLSFDPTFTTDFLDSYHLSLYFSRTPCYLVFSRLHAYYDSSGPRGNWIETTST